MVEGEWRIGLEKKGGFMGWSGEGEGWSEFGPVEGRGMMVDVESSRLHGGDSGGGIEYV